ncbi:MAG: VOC family protein [Pseudonocardiaceae bacterium]|nr:VOC family protein [Pseudonocardiaceae bacterium]
MRVTRYEPGTPCWVDMGSPDPAATAEFYRGLFGWDFVDTGPDTGGYQLCTVRGLPVAGIGSQQEPGPPWWTTYVSVADVDGTTEAVLRAGGQVLAEPLDVMEIGTMAVFADPLGATFSAWQPGNMAGAELVNETGALCWNELATRDLARSEAFYHSVFGWAAKTHVYGPTSYTEWHLGGRTIGGMMPMDERWPADRSPHWLVYFAVEGTGAAVRRATEHGGAVTVPDTDTPAGKFAVLTDRHGATFAVITLAGAATNIA